MEIKDYIGILWRRKWVILLTLVVTVTVDSIGTHLTTLVYQAAAVLRIAVSSWGPLSYSDYQYADQLMNTYVEMATRRPVLEELMQRLALTESPNIKAEIIPNTELIKITVEDTNPKRAAKAANTLADILIAQGNQLYVGGGKRLSEILGKQMTQIQTDLDETRTQYEKLLLQTPPAPDEIEKYNVNSLALVGHEPMLSQFVSWLTTGDANARITLKKGGVCLLSAEDLYQDHRATLEWLLTPALMVELSK